MYGQVWGEGAMPHWTRLSSILTTIHGSVCMTYLPYPLPRPLLHSFEDPLLQHPSIHFSTHLSHISNTAATCLLSAVSVFPAAAHLQPSKEAVITKTRRLLSITHRHPPLTPHPHLTNGQIPGWLALCRSLLTSSSQPIHLHFPRKILPSDLLV